MIFVLIQKKLTLNFQRIFYFKNDILWFNSVFLFCFDLYQPIFITWSDIRFFCLWCLFIIRLQSNLVMWIFLIFFLFVFKSFYPGFFCFVVFLFLNILCLSCLNHHHHHQCIFDFIFLRFVTLRNLLLLFGIFSFRGSNGDISFGCKNGFKIL